MRASRRAITLGVSLLLLGASSVQATRLSTGTAPPPAIRPTETWTSGDKDGFGTAYSYDAAGSPKPSRVWFTLGNGSLTEMYYPTVDTVAANRLFFLVADGKHRTLDETRDFQVTTSRLDTRAPAYRVRAINPTYHVVLTKDVLTDPTHDTLLVRVSMIAPRGFRLYADLEPALLNTGSAGQIAYSHGIVESWKPGAALALAGSSTWDAQTVGYRKAGDGLEQLQQHHRLHTAYSAAGPGHVDSVIELRSTLTTLALGFGKDRSAASAAARASLRRGFSTIEAAYIAGWHRYTSSLNSLGGHADPWYYASVMAIKSAEDKTYSGAIVASPTHPFGQITPDDSTAYGYAKVWPRDLYHSAMGLLAAGDRTTANEALGFLAKVQFKDGLFPQNAHVPYQAADLGVQLDEVADPILLAWRLNRQDLYTSLVKRAAAYLVAHGPSTPQERWEETGGYSPSTIAAEIAGLVAAGAMAHRAGDHTAEQRDLKTADSWQKSLEGWTYTTTGPLGGHRYYLRLSQGNPNAAQPISLANGGGNFDQRQIVDGGFLELVRLGIRAPHDSHILATLPVEDNALQITTPNGPAWHRYNHDGYDNVDGHGHPWPVLAGERGMYDLIAGQRAAATRILTALRSFGGSAGLLPEQVYERTGTPTTSARPLIWAEGEYLVLDRSIHDGKPFDLPSVVAGRYASLRPLS